MLDINIEMDLNDHIVVIASKVLGLVIESKSDILFDTALNKFLKAYPNQSPDNFADALSLLYGLGCIKMENMRIGVDNV